MTYNTDQDPYRADQNSEQQPAAFPQEHQPQQEQYPFYQTGAMPPPRRKANGKHYFSARTVLIPLIFFVVHYGIQSLVATLVAVLKIAPELISGRVLEQGDIQDAIYSGQTLILLISGTISIIVYIVALAILSKRNKNYVLTKKPSIKEFGSSIAMTFGMLGGTTLIVLGIQLMAEFSDFWSSHLNFYIELTQVFTDESSIILQILAIAIIIPIAEELLFRAIVCGELMRVFPNWAVILLSGGFFAIIHFNVVQSTYVLLAGIALSAVYVWSRSLVLTITMHAVFNFLGSTVPMLLGENENVMMWISYVQLAFVPIAIGIAVWFYMKQRSEAAIEV